MATATSPNQFQIPVPANANVKVSRVDREELEAVRTALYGRPLAKMKVLFRAGKKLLDDPDDTRQVFLMGTILRGNNMRRATQFFQDDPEGAFLLRHRPAIDSNHVDYGALRAMPEDTLGGAYVRFLDERGLSPDIFQAPPGMPEDMGYVVQRMRQTHDLWHVVTGCRTDVPGEVELQAFYFGQLFAPLPFVLALFGLLKHSWKNPSIPRRVIQGFWRGRRAKRLATVHWERRWDMRLMDVRSELELV